MKEMKELTEDNFNEEVLDSDVFTLVDFFAQWCGPCRQMSPILDLIAEEMETLKIVKVDVGKEENKKLVEEYEISNIPIMKLFKSGEIIKEFVGLRNKESLTEELKDIVTEESK